MAAISKSSMTACVSFERLASRWAVLAHVRCGTLPLSSHAILDGLGVAIPRRDVLFIRQQVWPSPDVMEKMGAKDALCKAGQHPEGGLSTASLLLRRRWRL